MSRSGAAPRTVALDPAGRRLADLARSIGLEGAAEELGAITGGARDEDPRGPACPVLSAAASGVLWLTGPPDGPPLAVPAPHVENVAALARGIGWLSARAGRRIRPRAAALLGARAASRGFTRGGRASANRSCRLLRCAEGWAAVNLARPADVALLPAVTAGLGLPGPGVAGDEPWGVLEAVAAAAPASELVERIQLLGIPAATLGDPGRAPAVSLLERATGAARAPRRRGIGLVVDLSAMWAGPLCAHLLGAAGATVVKVEDPSRPDAARTGDPALFAELHRGHRVAQVELATPAGARALRALLERADVVIEASRPRALAQLGISPEDFLAARAGRTWVSITGYGRAGDRANWVAFGDDAAVAGGIVGTAADGTPVFCGDAMADPASGAVAALGAVASVVAGGGHLVDVSMAGAAAWVAAGERCSQTHEVRRAADGWWVRHGTGPEWPVEPPRAAPVLG